MPCESRSKVVLLTPQERALLRSEIWGRKPGPATPGLDLTPEDTDSALSDLQARLGIHSRRALIARALVYGWV